MALMLIAIYRRPNLSREAFADYWRNTHAPLVRDLAADLGIVRYTQLHPEDAATPPWEGLAQVYFEGRHALETRLATAAGRAAARRLHADERNFIDLDRTVRWWSSKFTVL